jgi:O-antigen ligase
MRAAATRRPVLPSVNLGMAATILVIIYLFAIVALQATGRLPFTRAVVLVLVPGLMWLATQAPAKLVLLYVALPPGLLFAIGGISVGALTLMFAGTLALSLLLRHGRLSKEIVIPAGAIAILIASSHVFFEATTSAAAGGASEFRRTMLLYLVLFVLGASLASTGELRFRDLGSAILLSAGISGLIFMWQTGFRPWTYTIAALSAEIEPGLLFYRTHFGYVMALGFAVALARVLSHREAKNRAIDVAILAVFSVLVTFSFTRGAWLVALLLLTTVPIRTGRKAFWLLVPVIVLIAIGVPMIHERLFSDLSGGLQRSLESGDLGTGRWGLWQELWDRALLGLPFGQGYGFVWSLSPSELFGVEAFTTETNPFVYAHNDFLYWTVELGLIGAAAILTFWVSAVRVARRVGRLLAERSREASFLGGIVLTMLIASLVDNGLFIRAVAERFFIIVGGAWGFMAWTDRAEQDDQP